MVASTSLRTAGRRDFQESRIHRPATVANAVPATPGQRPASLRAWQRQLITTPAPASAGGTELPADYRALDSLFLAGGRGDGDAR